VAVAFEQYLRGAEIQDSRCEPAFLQGPGALGEGFVGEESGVAGVRGYFCGGGEGVDGSCSFLGGGGVGEGAVFGRWAFDIEERKTLIVGGRACCGERDVCVFVDGGYARGGARPFISVVLTDTTSC
jgi:hypothetical protein